MNQEAFPSTFSLSKPTVNSPFPLSHSCPILEYYFQTLQTDTYNCRW